MGIQIYYPFYWIKPKKQFYCEKEEKGNIKTKHCRQGDEKMSNECGCSLLHGVVCIEHHDQNIQQAKQEEAKEIFDELDKEHEKSVGIPYEIYLEIKKKRLSTINTNSTPSKSVH